MHTPIPFPTGRGVAGFTTRAMDVTLAYENLSAALWASETLTELFGRIADGPEPRFSPWNFSTLENPLLQARATAGALHSDLIVIAISSANRLLPASVEAWLGKCLAKRRGAHTAVAALFGPWNPPDRPDSLTLRSLQHLTREAGCELIVPSVNEPALSVA